MDRIRLAAVLLLMACSACAKTKVVDVKSPCVSGPNGPCGPRRPVNTWLYEYRRS